MTEHEAIFVDKLERYDSYKISGKTKRSFADIYVQKRALKVQVSRYPKYDDPKSMLIKTNEYWTLGYHLFIKNPDQIENALDLIKQGFNYVRETSNG